jgi:quercetin dioxygenase-like cupin family protein
MSTTAAARVMARGRNIELRLWERDPAGQRALEPDHAHEHANYVQRGALIVLIGDDPPLEVHAGDSYVVPAGLRHSLEVLEPAVVVEAISPPDRSY